MPSRWNLSRWCDRLQIGVVEIRPYDRDIAGEGQFYGGQYMWLRNEAFKDFLFKSPSGAVAARLRSETIQLYYDFLLTKQPGASNPPPWHQDRLYYPLSGKGECAVPLDRA